MAYYLYILEQIIDKYKESEDKKSAEWIDDKCSACGKGIEDLIDSREWYKNEAPNYCPFCGARMVEPTEREVKNK